MTQRTVSILRTHDDREIPVSGAYTIDPDHTSVEFVGRHMMITKVRGRFPGVSGTISIAEEPERSHVEVEFEVATLDTGNADRDQSLRSPDFSTPTGTRPSPSGRPRSKRAGRARG